MLFDLCEWKNFLASLEVALDRQAIQESTDRDHDWSQIRLWKRPSMAFLGKASEDVIDTRLARNMTTRQSNWILQDVLLHSRVNTDGHVHEFHPLLSGRLYNSWDIDLLHDCDKQVWGTIGTGNSSYGHQWGFPFSSQGHIIRVGG